MNILLVVYYLLLTPTSASGRPPSLRVERGRVSQLADEGVSQVRRTNQNTSLYHFACLELFNVVYFNLSSI